MKVSDLTVKEDNLKTQAFIKQMEAGEIDDFSLIKKYFKKDGSYLYARTSVRAFRDEKGNLLYLIKMIEDITEQHKLEAQKENLMQELEESNQGLQDYAHIVSHDLKSPLNSLNALTNWVIEDYGKLLPEDGKQNLNLMLEKIEKMASLIDGILKYSSIQRKELKKEKVDLNLVVADLLKTIHVPDHIQLYARNKLPTILGDYTKLYQLFQNIIGNAIAYNDKEKGEVYIESKSLKDYWQIAISDNGPGIPEKYHQKIFDVFQSVADEPSSSGIGLSIVKKIIDVHNGKIWLESKAGEGATFYFTIKKIKE
jgi:light-regulated signal transduction histidine kinase (bacteriophytochrome)